MRRSLHPLTVSTPLLHHDMEGPKGALKVEKKHKKKADILPLQQQEVIMVELFLGRRVRSAK